MGFKDKIKSFKEDPKGKLKSAWLSSSQITSTLNDFSTVEKATIKLANSPKDEIKSIKVQINPNDINYSFYSKPAGTQQLLYSKLLGNIYEVESEANPLARGTMTFTLYYDFYDEYYARSANGSGFSLNNLTGSFDLTNEKYSSLQTIVEKSKERCFIYFKWGSIEEFGQIDTIGPEYNVFSPWGEPLKGHITVNMSLMNVKHLTGIVKDIHEAMTKSGGMSLGSTMKRLGSTIKALR